MQQDKYMENHLREKIPPGSPSTAACFGPVCFAFQGGLKKGGN
jgi:hypothetical protein